MDSNCARLASEGYWGPGQPWPGTELSRPPLALRFSVHVLHVHFEVVIAGELLMAQLALGHGPVRIVRQLVPAEHLLQAERQVTNLRETQKRNAFCRLHPRNGHVWVTGHRSQTARGRLSQQKYFFFPPPEARGHACNLTSIINEPFYTLQMAPSPSINHSNPPPAGVQLQFKACRQGSQREPLWRYLKCDGLHSGHHTHTHSLHLWLYGKQIQSDGMKARGNTSFTGTPLELELLTTYLLPLLKYTFSIILLLMKEEWAINSKEQIPLVL